MEVLLENVDYSQMLLLGYTVVAALLWILSKIPLLKLPVGLHLTSHGGLVCPFKSRAIANGSCPKWRPHSQSHVSVIPSQDVFDLLIQHRRLS
jgi:hypothetical protein